MSYTLAAGSRAPGGQIRSPALRDMDSTVIDSWPVFYQQQLRVYPTNATAAPKGNGVIITRRTHTCVCVRHLMRACRAGKRFWQS